MVSKPKFSILICAYNAEKYIRDCIESILRQGFQSYEIIVVNDGSKDKTGEILEEYAKKDNRIKTYYWENHGLILARRKALIHASGEYILFLDADDYYLGDALEELNKIIYKENPDILLYRFSFQFEEGRKKASQNFGIKFYYNEKETLFKDLISHYEYNHLCCKAIKREIIMQDECNYKNFQQIQLGEDLLQTIPLFYIANKVMTCDKILYGYRVLKRSMSHGFSEKNIEDINTVYQYFMEYLINKELMTTDIENLLYSTYITKIASIIRELWKDCYKTSADKIAISQKIMKLSMMSKGKLFYREIVLQNRILLLLVQNEKWEWAKIYSKILESV